MNQTSDSVIGWYHVEGCRLPLWFDGENLFDDPGDDEPYGAEWLKQKREGPLVPAAELQQARAAMEAVRKLLDMPTDVNFRVFKKQLLKALGEQ